ncbi:hypothetical protein [Bdellovibrio sp. NC01]|uniref:hypothetical protein n=1 Tax=Bdellovibrio sp. NC01 TaxID=2220073 RepID=UPI00115BD18E|nr:hypothetical protein [Bdellovibrio sp. NC01]QDK38486.1 hypothetical protein DOE51_13310 [Bdellovibrio sp. NC01]
MKKMKVASLAIAGMMVVQATVSHAETSRVDGIGDKQIAVAQKQLSAVRTQILLLDKSLEETATAIQTREKGGLSNGAAIVGAGIGLGFSALTMLGTLGSTGDGGGMVGVIIGSLGSLAATAGSLGMSGVSAYLKADANTESIEADLAKAQKDIADTMALTTDKASAALLSQLNASLSEVQKSLISYRKDESARSKHKLMANIAEATGMALTTMGLVSRDSAKLTNIGTLVMGAGNLGRIITGMSDSQAEQVLTEITKTRQSLRIAAAALE